MQKGKGSKKGFRQAVLKGHWKAVRYGQKSKTQLYNLKDDLYETKNVAAEHPEIVDRMNRILRKESVKSENYPYSGGVVQ